MFPENYDMPGPVLALYTHSHLILTITLRDGITDKETEAERFKSLAQVTTASMWWNWRVGITRNKTPP